MKKNLLFLGVLLATVALLFSCVKGRTNNNDGDSRLGPGSDSIPEEPATTYNIYVENSGSMKGFFRGNTLKQIIKEYHDRIKATHSPITLNYINNNIVRSNQDIGSYLNTLYQRCNATLSELDKILELAMDTLGPNDVNIVISDYCFESRSENFEMARSGITKIFQQRLNTGKDLAVAIIKYNCDFNGTVYPSKKSCTHDLPAYVWAFGTTRQIKEFLQLPIKLNSERFVMEPYKEIMPEYKIPKSRMLDKKNNSIIVKNWNSVRNRDSKIYTLSFELCLSELAIDESYLIDTLNYNVSNGYSLKSIKRSSDKDTYEYQISTNHPSPGMVEIDLVNKFPQWVSDSNYEDDRTAPDSGKTYGIKYLIEGVYDAYNYANKNIFTVNINLK